MVTSLIISLRETLETSLIVAVILTVLTALNEQKLRFWVWMGVGAGILSSIVLALVFHHYSASLTGEAREIYEGVVMLTAAALITWMMMWMHRHAGAMKENIQNTAELSVQTGSALGIFFLTFTTTAREGAEMVLMLHAALLGIGGDIHVVSGILLGIALAILIALLAFRGMKRVSIKGIFRSTSIALLFLSLTLFYRGIHELLEVFEAS